VWPKTEVDLVTRALSKISGGRRTAGIEPSAYEKHVQPERDHRRSVLNSGGGSSLGTMGDEKVRWAMKKLRWFEIVVALRCPTCGSTPDEKCTTHSGQDRTDKHSQRAEVHRPRANQASEGPVIVYRNPGRLGRLG
jgi:hypothetical protein